MKVDPELGEDVHVTVAVPNCPVLCIVKVTVLNPVSGSETLEVRELDTKLMLPVAADKGTVTVSVEEEPTLGDEGGTSDRVTV